MNINNCSSSANKVELSTFLRGVCETTIEESRNLARRGIENTRNGNGRLAAFDFTCASDAAIAASELEESGLLDAPTSIEDVCKWRKKHIEVAIKWSDEIVHLIQGGRFDKANSLAGVLSCNLSLIRYCDIVLERYGKASD